MSQCSWAFCPFKTFSKTLFTFWNFFVGKSTASIMTKFNLQETPRSLKFKKFLFKLAFPSFLSKLFTCCSNPSNKSKKTTNLQKIKPSGTGSLKYLRFHTGCWKKSQVGTKITEFTCRDGWTCSFLIQRKSTNLSFKKHWFAFFRTIPFPFSTRLTKLKYKNLLTLSFQKLVRSLKMLKIKENNF